MRRLAMSWHGNQLSRIADPALIYQVTAAYRAKYANQPSLVAMLFLTPPGTEATLRVDQR
jgi:hypothetical protein